MGCGNKRGDVSLIKKPAVQQEGHAAGKVKTLLIRLIDLHEYVCVCVCVCFLTLYVYLIKESVISSLEFRVSLRGSRSYQNFTHDMGQR